MQDDNTNQVTDNSEAGQDENIIEPTLGLGTNPSDPSVTTGDDSVSSDSAATAGDDASVDQTTDDTTSDDSGSSATEEISSESSSAEDGSDSSPAPGVSGDLDSIRSSALQELTPLLSELEQEPEEKYRTLMMIIQSSDNQDLIKQAYEAAENIDDKKTRAEALLTIVNEINYFSGKDDKSQSED